LIDVFSGFVELVLCLPANHLGPIDMSKKKEDDPWPSIMETQDLKIGSSFLKQKE
jgi:hypothetical protein